MPSCGSCSPDWLRRGLRPRYSPRHDFGPEAFLIAQCQNEGKSGDVTDALGPQVKAALC
jgi:hypothetical protein